MTLSRSLEAWGSLGGGNLGHHLGLMTMQTPPRSSRDGTNRLNGGRKKEKKKGKVASGRREMYRLCSCRAEVSALFLGTA